jgi:subtilisin family serine protease
LEDFGNPPNSGDNDTRFNLQWGHTAVQAADAWNEGVRGAGVRVAVLDSGIDATHPDLAPNVNSTLSKSFVPGESWQVQPGFYFNHGTHVAGTIAAADNGYGIIGIAPYAELVAVKVLSEYTGSGDFDWVISGIVYATDIESDIINMSLGAVLTKNGYMDDNGTADPGDDFWVGANEVAALRNALSRATTYAYQNGTTVIVSAGNDAIDRDHDAATTVLPADSDHVIQVSATAPIGWGVDPTVSLDNLASYSNYGQSAIDFAAPGGDFLYYFVSPSQLCTVASITRPCYVFDYVFSDIPGGFGWAAGTSMAAPHVSGVAALIISKNGGEMKPAQVEAALRASADDLGKPGNDDAYGAGRVNAYNAVR